MLVTDVGDEICWWQLQDDGDGFGLFGHQHPLSLCITSGNNIQKMSPTSNFRHQHPQIVINFKSPTSLSPKYHVHFFQFWKSVLILIVIPKNQWFISSHSLTKCIFIFGEVVRVIRRLRTLSILVINAHTMNGTKFNLFNQHMTINHADKN